MAHAARTVRTGSKLGCFHKAFRDFFVGSCLMSMAAEDSCYYQGPEDYRPDDCTEANTTRCGDVPRDPVCCQPDLLDPTEPDSSLAYVFSPVKRIEISRILHIWWHP